MRKPRIYLDSCCFNRPYDDLSQDKVRLECESGKGDYTIEREDALKDVSIDDIVLSIKERIKREVNALPAGDMKKLKGIENGEKEASQILIFSKETFSLKPKTWDDIEEDDPTSDEIAAFEEYRAVKA